MTPFLLLGLGMAIVLLLVIWLKVHPFLALIIAATVVSFATPEKSLESYADNYTQSQQDRGKMDESQALQFKKDFAKLSSMKSVNDFDTVYSAIPVPAYFPIFNYL